MKLLLISHKVCLLLDEVKISEALSFQWFNLKIEGFVNLGDYTSENDKNKFGNHALVFQRFCGKWFQTLDVFLGSGVAWNRNIWKLFGISDIKSSYEHPVNPERKLWFLSDFPRLIKNLKSRIINN